MDTKDKGLKQIRFEILKLIMVGAVGFLVGIFSELYGLRIEKAVIIALTENSLVASIILSIVCIGIFHHMMYVCYIMEDSNKVLKITVMIVLYIVPVLFWLIYGLNLCVSREGGYAVSGKLYPADFGN